LDVDGLFKASLLEGGLQSCVARLASGSDGGAALSGTEFDLEIAGLPVNYTGKRRIATAVNGRVPAPTLRFREGDTVTLRVHNKLDEMTSVHWHGLIVPAEMDGVPGISFGGIAPGETFTYRFPIRQSGTFWYHAHTLAEQTGLFGPS
jgi:FtsP/CotA-like multicopper oxidase with cupredoxin domain